MSGFGVQTLFWCQRSLFWSSWCHKYIHIFSRLGDIAYWFHERINRYTYHIYSHIHIFTYHISHIIYLYIIYIYISAQNDQTSGDSWTPRRRTPSATRDSPSCSRNAGGADLLLYRIMNSKAKHIKHKANQCWLIYIYTYTHVYMYTSVYAIYVYM